MNKWIRIVHAKKLGLKTFEEIRHVDYEQDNLSNESFIYKIDEQSLLLHGTMNCQGQCLCEDC
jgi:hypothetical protein